MQVELEPAKPTDLPEISALCLRSKAYWGYDAAFMAACEDELTLRPEDLSDHLIFARNGNVLVGTVCVIPNGPDAELAHLYIDPPFIGRGLGRKLFDWAAKAARKTGAARLVIIADPNAASFYAAMGANLMGESKSGSIPGRMLPQFEYGL